MAGPRQRRGNNRYPFNTQLPITNTQFLKYQYWASGIHWILEPISKIPFGSFSATFGCKTFRFRRLSATKPPQSSRFSLKSSSKLTQNYF